MPGQGHYALLFSILNKVWSPIHTIAVDNTARTYYSHVIMISKALSQRKVMRTFLVLALGLTFLAAATGMAGLSRQPCWASAGPLKARETCPCCPGEKEKPCANLLSGCPLGRAEAASISPILPGGHVLKSQALGSEYGPFPGLCGEADPGWMPRGHVIYLMNVNLLC